MKKQGKHFTTLLLCYHAGSRPTFFFFFLMWFDPPHSNKENLPLQFKFSSAKFPPKHKLLWRLLGTEIWKLPFSFCLWVEFPVCQEDGADLSLQSFWGGIALPRSPLSIIVEAAIWWTLTSRFWGGVFAPVFVTFSPFFSFRSYQRDSKSILLPGLKSQAKKMYSPGFPWGSQCPCLCGR